MRRSALVIAPALLALACGPTAKPAPTPPGRPVGDPAPPSGERVPSTDFTMTDRGTLALPGPIVFATGSADLDLAASEPALWHIHDYLVAKDAVTLARIEGTHRQGRHGAEFEWRPLRHTQGRQAGQPESAPAHRSGAALMTLIYRIAWRQK